MAQIPGIYQGSASNLFAGITPTASVAPMTTYDLETFTHLRPDERVKWDVNTVTLTWSGVDASIEGEIFILTVSNLDPGTSVASLTNSDGMSQALTIPAVPLDRIPLTTIVDVSGFTSAQKTSTTWQLVISGNSVNVTLGAAIALYGPKTSFLGQMAADNFSWDFKEKESHGKSEKSNEYKTRWIIDLLTRERSIECMLPTNEAGVDAIRSWYRSAHGGALPSLFWPDPNVNDALLGTWADFEVRHTYPNYRPITLTFTELSKGIPLL